MANKILPSFDSGRGSSNPEHTQESHFNPSLPGHNPDHDSVSRRSFSSDDSFHSFKSDKSDLDGEQYVLLNKDEVPEKSWATEEAGWRDRSYGQVPTLLTRATDRAGEWGNKVLSLWNAFGQIVLPKNNASREFLGQGDNLKVLENIAEKIKQERNRNQDYSGGAFPIRTVEKLLDDNGPRSGRLSAKDIDYLAKTVGNSDRVVTVDGYSTPVSGIRSTGIKDRKPSEKIMAALGVGVPSNAGKTVLMPFSFPAKGMSEEHIVLIAADPKTKEIRYFDSKGAPSDDPARIGGFRDEPEFNMHADLLKLQRELGDGWTVKENNKAYQKDVTNCGTYVALAMRDEAQGRPVGQGWESGPAWVNAQKPALAQEMVDHYRNELRGGHVDDSKDGQLFDNAEEEDYTF